MGNTASLDVGIAEESEEPAPQPIQFHTVEPRLIKNPFPSYEGFLIESLLTNGRGTGKVIRTEHLTPGNKNKALVQVYTYTSTQPVDGTYVVLQFNQSEKFFGAHKNKPDKLIVKKGGWDPDNAEDITTTADRRVFLLKPSQPGSSDVVFASRGSRRVITVFRNVQRFAELEDEGTGEAVEAQRYQLVIPHLRRAAAAEGSGGDFLEVVPSPSKPLDSADEELGCLE